MFKRFAPILVLVGACWLVFGINNLLDNGQLSRFGIVPRHLANLAGILWAPFLHASFKHLAANTGPLLILGGVLCGRSRAEFAVVTILGILAGGGLTWLVARNGCHIGASGLIFCYFGYLASMALFKRTLGTLALSVVCIVVYGGLLRGVLPTSTPVSWEAHVAGFVTGVALAGLATKLAGTSSSAPEVKKPEMPQPLG
jgi:membrane associated rhomboid family serine protease